MKRALALLIVLCGCGDGVRLRPAAQSIVDEEPSEDAGDDEQHEPVVQSDAAVGEPDASPPGDQSPDDEMDQAMEPDAAAPDAATEPDAGEQEAPRHQLTIAIVGDENCQGLGHGFVAGNQGGLSCGTLDPDNASCTRSFFRGTIVELSALPQESTSFLGFSGACSTTETSCAVTVDRDVTVHATFCGLFL